MKVSLPVPSNACCPQAFYTYGTYKEDGTPNFGLFCWFGFCWDGELSVMACIGGEKLTKDRIRATGRFSANLVTEELLPLAAISEPNPATIPTRCRWTPPFPKGAFWTFRFWNKARGSSSWRSSR